MSRCVNVIPLNSKNQQNNELLDLLVKSLEPINVELSCEQCKVLVSFVLLLAKWNEVYNLSGISDVKQMLARHLIDSLSILPLLRRLKPQRVIDVGTGPGLPGIPLAIAMPECQFLLLDSRMKRTRFLRQCNIELALTNIGIKQCRVEKYQPESPYDVVVSRAFASLSDMLSCCNHLVDNGYFLAMKGQLSQTETRAVPEKFTLVEHQQMAAGAMVAERNILVYQRTTT